MNNNLQKIKNELDQHGYGTIDYPDKLRVSVLELVDSFKDLCVQNIEHKIGMNYQNSMGYENRDRIVNPDIVDHKESFYIKSTYEFPQGHTPSSADKNFAISCKKLLIEIVPLVKDSAEILSQISETDLLELFDYSALTLRAIHYYPDTNDEIAHHHVDRGGQTYHLYESTDGLESYWNDKWNTIHLNEGQTIYFPCIQAQYATKSKLKGLCHRVVSTEQSKVQGRYSLVLFVDYNRLSHKYSIVKAAPIEKAFLPGQNYSLTFSQLQDYFEEKQKMYRKGVSALILNKDNEVLLVNLESFEPQFFAIPGGGVESGEIPKEAVYREIKEEISIKRDPLELIGISKEPLRLLFKNGKLSRDGVEYDGMEREFFGFLFTGDDSEIVLQPEEIRSYKWVGLSDLKNYLLFENQLEDTLRKIAEIFPDLDIR